MNFHRQHGLSISPPRDWPILECIKDLVDEVSQTSENHITIIYPSTQAYKSLSSLEEHTTAPNPLVFFAWQELYVAMDQAGKDTRELQRFKHILETSHLTIFFGAPIGIREVVDQVRGLCEGCLIIFG